MTRQDPQPDLSPAEDTTETLVLLGARIRGLRRERKMTLQDLSAKTGVSPGMISLVERARANASMWTLSNIAHGFEMSLTELLAGPAGAATEIVTRQQDIPPIQTPDRVNRILLRQDMHRGIDVTVNEYAPGVSNSAAGLQHPGYEFGYVLEGELLVEVEGVPHVIGTGDLISLQSTRLHRISNQGPGIARAIWFNMNKDGN